MSEFSPESKSNINSLHLFAFFYKWRKTIIAVAILSAFSSMGVAYMIPEKFKSTVILFPAPSVSISKSLMGQNTSPQSDLLRFGEEDDMERMLQVLNSEEIRNRIVSKYKLDEHYGIEKDNKFRQTLLRQEYDDNIQYKKTEYMSVKIEVMDRDPDTAALIANDIAALHDSTKIRIQHERAKEALKIVEREYRSKLKEIGAMEDSLKVINGFGLFDYESQSEVTSEQYAIAIAKNDVRAIKSLEEKLQVIGKYGSAYVSLRDNMYMQRKQLNLLKSKYDEAKVDAVEILPQKFVVSNAYPAEKKSYPVRWIIVVVSSMATLLISMIVILLLENIRQFRSGK